MRPNPPESRRGTSQRLHLPHATRTARGVATYYPSYRDRAKECLPPAFGGRCSWRDSRRAIFPSRLGQRHRDGNRILAAEFYGDAVRAHRR